MTKEVDDIVDEYCEKHPHLKPYRDKMRRKKRKGPSIAEHALAHFRKPES